MRVVHEKEPLTRPFHIKMVGKLPLCLARIQELATAEIVVPGDHEGGDELHELVADAQKCDTDEHEEVIQAQADGRENGEDRELTLAGEVTTMGEDVAHAEEIVNDHGRNERYRRRDEKIDVQNLDENEKKDVVDGKRHNADGGELCELFRVSLFERFAHGTSRMSCGRSPDCDRERYSTPFGHVM